jgi:ERCC4-type nuclease
MDYIVERKGSDDLVESIKDGRYERQKIQMARSGLLGPMYIVEGNLDELPAGQKAAKTACAQTEIWAGAGFRDGDHQLDPLYAQLPHYRTTDYSYSFSTSSSIESSTHFVAAFCVDEWL